MKGIYKTKSNTYALEKYGLGKSKKEYIGCFPSLKIAQLIRDYLEQHEYQLEQNIILKNKQYHVFIEKDHIHYLGAYDTRAEAEEKLEQPDLQYISFVDNRYRVQKQFGNNDNLIYGSFISLTEALWFRNKIVSHNWDWKYSRKLVVQTPTYKNRNIYYDKTRGNYIVHRYKNNVNRTYGRYKTFKEAEKRRNQLYLNDWEDEYDMEFIDTTKKGVYRIMRQTREKGKPLRIYYGEYKTLEECKKARDQLVKDGFPENKITCKTRIMRYIETNKDKKGNNFYTIRKSINGKRQSFGYSNNQKYIIALRDLIENNGWEILEPDIYEHEDKFYLVSLTPKLYNTILTSSDDKEKLEKPLLEELIRLDKIL